MKKIIWGMAGISFLLFAGTLMAAVDINNITVSAVKTNSAVIVWESSATATSEIEYGLTGSYGNITPEQSLNYFHTTELTGLSEGVTQHFRIRAKDSIGVETLSTDYTFTTKTQAELDAAILAARQGDGMPKVYYVKLGGKDSDDGLSTDTAWEHISYAASMVKAGDLVLVASGNYGNENIAIKYKGSEYAPIIFQAMEPGQAVLTGNGTGVSWIVEVSKYITIDGFKFTNFSQGIEMAGSDNIVIKRCVFNFVDIPGGNGIRLMFGNNILYTLNEFFVSNEGTGDYELQLYYGKNVTVTNNYFRGWGHQMLSLKDGMINTYISSNTFAGFQLTAIYLGQNDRAMSYNAVVENNTFHPYFLDSISYRAHDAIVARFIENVEIRKNVIDGVDHAGIYLINPSRYVKAYQNIVANSVGNNSAGLRVDFTATKDWEFCNNTIYNNYMGLYLYSTPGSGVVKNNIFYNNASQVYGDFGNVTFSYNNWYPDWTGDWYPNWEGITSNSISVDPLFADPANKDFHLQSAYGRWNGASWVVDSVTSLAIDAGDPVDNYSNEPAPNGERVNLGAYGNTLEASKNATRVLTSLTVSPSNATIAIVGTQIFAAAPKDQNGNTLTGNTINWKSSNPAVAIVNSHGVVTGLSLGTSIITAYCGSVIGIATVTVSALSGPVAHWTFDEGTGTTANDSSGNANTGTLTNMNTGIDNGNSGWTINGKLDKALMFDGVDDYVNLGNRASLQIADALTIAGWVKLSVSSPGTLIGGDWGAGYWVGWGNDTHMYFDLWGVNGFIDVGGLSSKLGQWQHHAATYDGSNMYIYENGVVKKSIPAAGKISNVGTLKIGRLSAFYQANGAIDDVRLYNRALSAGEILAIYRAANPAPDIVPPALTITSPAEGTTFTTTIVTVSGTAADNVAVSKIELKVTGGNWLAASGTNNWSKRISLKSGQNIIQAKATDSSQLSTEVSIVVSYNNALNTNKIIKVQPNPYIAGKSNTGKISFSELNSEATLRVYKISGELVKEIVSNNGEAEWEVNEVDSGVYLYVITSPEGVNKGKVSIIK